MPAFRAVYRRGALDDLARIHPAGLEGIAQEIETLRITAKLLRDASGYEQSPIGWDTSRLPRI